MTELSYEDSLKAMEVALELMQSIAIATANLKDDEFMLITLHDDVQMTCPTCKTIVRELAMGRCCPAHYLRTLPCDCPLEPHVGMRAMLDSMAFTPGAKGGFPLTVSR